LPALGDRSDRTAQALTGNPSQEIKGDQKIGPGEDIELLWVGEAVSVAKSAAEKSGWSSVPWQDLVEEVLKIG
jgi:hypothetical protein